MEYIKYMYNHLGFPFKLQTQKVLWEQLNLPGNGEDIGIRLYMSGTTGEMNYSIEFTKEKFRC